MEEGGAVETDDRPEAHGQVERRPLPRRALLFGGAVGAVAGVAGATVTDSKMGFPAWVDLTGVLGGFATGVLVTGLVVVAVRLGSALSGS